MKIESQAKLVTIYVNSTDRWHGQSLYAAIVQVCKERGIAGVTVNLFESITQDTKPIASTTTDASGNYAFSNLPGGHCARAGGW